MIRARKIELSNIKKRLSWIHRILRQRFRVVHCQHLGTERFGQDSSRRRFLMPEAADVWTLPVCWSRRLAKRTLIAYDLGDTEKDFRSLRRFAGVLSEIWQDRKPALS